MINPFFTFQNLKHKNSKSSISKDELERHTEKANKLDNYINFVRNILERNNLSDLQKKSVIIKIIKTLSLNVQNERVEELLPLLKTNKALNPLCLEKLDFRCPTCSFHIGCTYEDLKDMKYYFSLNTTPVFSALWDAEKMVSALFNVRQTAGIPFEYDEANHNSNISIYPIGLVLIGNGYHSATAGIYDCGSTLPLHSYTDISSYYDTVLFNGMAFIHKSSNTIHSILKPKYSDTGIIYEIGRLLYNLTISPTDIHSQF